MIPGGDKGATPLRPRPVRDLRYIKYTLRDISILNKQLTII